MRSQEKNKPLAALSVLASTVLASVCILTWSSEAAAKPPPIPAESFVENELRTLFLALVVSRDSGLASSVGQWREARRLERTMFSLWRSLPPSSKECLERFRLRVESDPGIRAVLSAKGGDRPKDELLEAAFARVRSLLESSTQGTVDLVQEIASKLGSTAANQPRKARL